MFFERQENEMFEPVQMSFLGSMDTTVYDDLCQLPSTGNHLKDDQWQKVQNLLPTPPCSPEDLCYQAFPELMQAPTLTNYHHGLQVVPDNIPDDLVDPLPVLELSDEEMQKLTSPTVFDESIWHQTQARVSLQPAQSVPSPSTIQPTNNSAEHFENNTINVSDMNYISHGIRTVHISDSVIRTPGYSQSFVLTVNANPIQPLNTLAHLTNREILMTPNATTWCLNANPNLLNENAATRVSNFESRAQPMMPDSPSKKNRKIRRLSRCNSSQDSAGSPEENTEDSEDGETIRATHNVLERKRREELKEKFQRLRDCLPELQDNDRAPKVLILKKSCEYIKYLEQEEQRLLADKELERQRFLILFNKQRNFLRHGLIGIH